MTCVLAEVSRENENPLELSDIMPDNSKTYDKMRPPKYKGNATEVLFHVTVMSLDTIDESSMTYTCDVFFAQSWKDNRLRLPDNMTSEYRLLPIEWLTEIWRPDSFFKNAKSVTFQTMTIPNHYIWLWKDKTILYMVKLTLVLSCPMHFKNYPHDTQECNLEIESISHTTDDLVFIWDPQMPLDVDKGIELPQLELISTKNDDCTTEYSTGKFTCLEVVFKFKRRLGYYLFHTYVPTCLVVIMSWISFWIKPEAVPARVTLGVTSLLTLSTQHANSQKSLPPVSYIKAIDVFMSGCTVFVFLSLMEYALVNIVMGDIADIEKKKSMGISNLILGSRGLPIRQKEGGINQEEVIKFARGGKERSFSSFFPTLPGMGGGNKQQHASGGNSIPMTSAHIGGNSTGANTGVNLGVGGLVGGSGGNGATDGGGRCAHNRAPNHIDTIVNRDSEQLLFSPHGSLKPELIQQQQTSLMGSSASVGLDDGHTTYFMNRDGCMETATGSDAAAVMSAAAMGTVPNSLPPPPPPPLTSGGPSNVINQQGIKSLVHDVQLKRQKEIRDMMKKKREKAVLVDRISRWLFPTSFILLNIVYWALFGDHDLW